jgi:protease secretion system membrane fusion protein
MKPSEVASKEASQSTEMGPELSRLADTRAVSRMALWLLGIGFGGFVLFASMVPLDEGVPTIGTVVIDTKRKPVQHLQGGTIREVLVREGQMVQIGQVLIRLNDTAARAEFESARQTLANLHVQMKSRTVQLQLFERELASVRELVSRDHMPLVKQLELERQVSQLQSTIEEISSQIKTTEERIKVATETLSKTDIRSPDQGQVVGLAVQTSGAVIQPGQKVMDIVPQTEDLVLETRIFPHLIDRISVGDPVDVRFSAFANSPQLVVDGTLQILSKDVLMDEASKMPYYLARVTLTKDGYKALGDRKLQPGMPVEVVVKTGSRTLLQYIAHPLIKRIAASMKEE